MEQTTDFLLRIEHDPFDNMFIVTDSPGEVGGMALRIGQCSVYNIELGRQAEFGRLIKYIPSRFPEFLKTCDHIIETMMSFYRLDRVYATTLYTNKKALRFFAELGFSVERIAFKTSTPTHFVMERRR